MFKNITDSKKTTATAIVVILVWLLPKFVPGLAIPPDVQTAMITLVSFFVLLFAKDHNK